MHTRSHEFSLCAVDSFPSPQHLRHRFGGSEPGHHPVLNGLAGGIATMAHDAIVTPLDVVKQRLQVYNSSYRGVLQCIRSVFAQEGLRAFYASYPTTVAMNVPFQAVHFASYESFKILFTGEGTINERTPPTPTRTIEAHVRSAADDVSLLPACLCTCVFRGGARRPRGGDRRRCLGSIRRLHVHPI